MTQVCIHYTSSSSALPPFCTTDGPKNADFLALPTPTSLPVPCPQIEVSTPSPPRPEVPRKRPADLPSTLNDTRDDNSGKYSSANKGKRKANREPKRHDELGRVSSPPVAAPHPTLAPALPGTSLYLNSVGASASRWQGGLPFPPPNVARAAAGIASPYVGLPGMIGPGPRANLNQSSNGISGSFSSGIRPLPFPAAPNLFVQGPPPFFPVGGSNFWPTHWPHTNIPASLGSAAPHTRTVDVEQVDQAPERLAQQATSSSQTSPQLDDDLEIIVEDEEVQISSNSATGKKLGAPADRAILAQPWMQPNTGERGVHSDTSAKPLGQDPVAANDDFNVFDSG